MLIRFRDTHHYHLEASDGEMGPIKDVYFDDASWQIRYFVVDTRRWLLGRKVLLSPSALTALAESERLLKTNLTRAQVKNSPSIDEEIPVSRQHELALSNYFGWPQYWYATEPLGYPFAVSGLDYGLESEDTMQTLRKAAKERLERSDKHLRSAKETADYNVVLSTGEKIPINDFFIAFRDWTIALVEIVMDGERKVFPSAFVTSISFENGTIGVGLTWEDVRTSFSSLEDVPSLEELDAIYGHYGRLPLPQGSEPTVDKTA